VDFVTRHHYTTKTPERIGHYGYAELVPPELGLGELRTTRNIVGSFEEYKDIDIHLTEFNTSYIPDCPVHDTNLNAAYIAYLLSKLGEDHASYSYWTFGDVFEEQGVPFTTFHGGCGLVANGLIPKSTFWIFEFFKKLQGSCVHRSEEVVVLQKENGGYCGVAWNLTMQKKENRLLIEFQLPAGAAEKYCLLTKTVDKTCCNPLKLWHDLGEPANPTKAQLDVIRDGAQPLISTERLSAEEKMNLLENYN
jgi:xylan 1,4-beta-xylosidase